MIETQNLSFDEIAYRVCYEDTGAFRKIFLKQTGLRPTEYKRRFQRI